MRLEAPGEVVLVRPADAPADAGDGFIGVEQEYSCVLSVDMSQVSHRRKARGVLEQQDQVTGREVQVLGKLSQASEF